MFSAPDVIDNPLLSFPQDQVRIQFGRSDDSSEVIVLERLPGTRTVMGVVCARIRDRVFDGDLLVEDTEDWYAQDDDGNVWYMGEAVLNYEYDDEGNLLGQDDEGSWEAGLDVAGTGSVALPGYAMPDDPQPGQVWHQEFYEGEATDIFEILEVDGEVTLEDGRTYTGVLKTLDLNPLNPGIPEIKYYAPGIGFVREEKLASEELLEHLGTFDTAAGNVPLFQAGNFATPTMIDNPLFPLPFGTTRNYVGDTEDGEETVLIEVTGTTRVVNGINCSVIRDRSYLEGIIHEDTDDFYAQDDAGNVWYMGEEVDNYNYDDLGNLVSITHEGSWEAGLDVAGVGSAALPGYVMLDVSQVGDSYRQEIYPGEAEDMAVVVATGVQVDLLDGVTSYSNCLQTLEWNPHEPFHLEYKYYAPGVGVVRAWSLDTDEILDIEP
ncbi:MAG: hypothetical protein R3E96_01710 [Planctomycetota bacterium]